MFGNWQNYRIVCTKHFLIKISERGIGREEVESALKDEKKLCLALENPKKRVWEAYFRKSGKYQLKVILSADDAGKELKLITAYIINKKRARLVQKW